MIMLVMVDIINHLHLDIMEEEDMVVVDINIMDIMAMDIIIIQITIIIIEMVIIAIDPVQDPENQIMVIIIIII
eukprot:CAMPEP_0201570050 /NCGR_PEP_ID=MMETSP0190_2-20130828/12130_1 /ASSEMBLY_ACC=CAM_ASM_000263 /TAXON_ID=37353 /ORGANISM="Rosalina sp." /LENGTH=73 /DNA_ID=CAMNT_0047993169 /DNA_START=20 /DNA_END=238 /DNA_ORIENTATION=-